MDNVKKSAFKAIPPIAAEHKASQEPKVGLSPGQESLSLIRQAPSSVPVLKEGLVGIHEKIQEYLQLIARSTTARDMAQARWARACGMGRIDPEASGEIVLESTKLTELQRKLEIAVDTERRLREYIASLDPGVSSES